MAIGTAQVAAIHAEGEGERPRAHVIDRIGLDRSDSSRRHVAEWHAQDAAFGPTGLDGIQPHASVQAAHPVEVCVYLDPVNDSAPPTCMTGAPSTLGTYVGCCGSGEARLAFGGNLQNDDADVRISVSTLTDVCVDYSLTYGFGAGP